jgi:hypothetical protein
MQPLTLNVDIRDVIKNYDLKDDEGFLFCLFEAISNSLYCCIDNSDISIAINLYRDYKANEVIKNEDNFIYGFTVTDNGVGFTNENYDKFTKTIYKTNHDGGKGLGRISFLKVFEYVHIDSTFKNNSKLYNRTFDFSREKVKDTKKEAVDGTPIKTTITFKGLKSNFLDDTKRNMEYFSDEVLRHFYVFLNYLLEQGKRFEIRLVDDSGVAEGIINADKLKQDKIIKDTFIINDPQGLGDMNDINFEIVHIKTKNVDSNKAFYVVDERSAGEIANLDLPPGILEDKNGTQYFYNIYLKSPYFDRFLNESRTQLSIPSEKNASNKKYITRERIEQMLKAKVEKYLEYEIGTLNQKNEEKIVGVLSDENNNRISNNKAFLYILSDEKNKEKLLNSIKYSDNPQKVLSKVKEFHEELQKETIKQINITVDKIKNNKTNLDFARLEYDMQQLIDRVNTENIVNLSSYIMYRKYILTLLNEGLAVYKESKTQNEAFFHNLLLPKKVNNSINSNLWLLDDLFIYFEGTSEIAIEDIEINGKRIIKTLLPSEKELLNEFNKRRLEKSIDLLFFPEERQCIIIELKDPKVGLSENAHQMDKYAELIANFVSSDFSIETFFTYLITDHFNIYDRPTGYRKIYGIDGFVRHSIDIQKFETGQTIANQYAEVIRWTDIYERAKTRNKIFFTKMNMQEEIMYENRIT